MDFQGLQARTTLLLSYAGYTDVVPAPTMSLLVNQAWEEFSYTAECVVFATAFPSVPGVASYVLPGGPWKDVLDVVYSMDGAPARLHRSDEDWERHLSGLWRVTQGTPQRWTSTGAGVVHLIPVPSTNAPCSARGIVQGADMVLPTDRPGQVSGSIPNGQQTGILPTAFHEGIALWAAWLQGKVYEAGEENGRIQGYKQEADDYAMRLYDTVWRGTRMRKSPERNP